jgi:hypothetical protein
MTSSEERADWPSPPSDPPTSPASEAPNLPVEDVPNPDGDGAQDTGVVEASESHAKQVKRVVVSYRLGWLPGDWLQTWRRLDRVFARANLRVKATLAPLEDLPGDTDILVVPPDLRDEAKAAAPEGTPILVTPASAAAGAFAELVARLEAGTEFTAERIDPGWKRPNRKS